MYTYQNEWSSCLASCLLACWPLFTSDSHFPQRCLLCPRPLEGGPPTRLTVQRFFLGLSCSSSCCQASLIWFSGEMGNIVCNMQDLPSLCYLHALGLPQTLSFAYALGPGLTSV